MVNRTNKSVAGEIKLNRKAVSHTTSDPVSSQRSQHIETNDEVIGSLADAHENARARQVTEWEQMRRMVLRKAA